MGGSVLGAGGLSSIFVEFLSCAKWESWPLPTAWAQKAPLLIIDWCNSETAEPVVCFPPCALQHWARHGAVSSSEAEGCIWKSLVQLDAGAGHGAAWTHPYDVMDQVRHGKNHL